MVMDYVEASLSNLNIAVIKGNARCVTPPRLCRLCRYRYLSIQISVDTDFRTQQSAVVSAAPGWVTQLCQTPACVEYARRGAVCCLAAGATTSCTVSKLRTLTSRRSA